MGCALWPYRQSRFFYPLKNKVSMITPIEYIQLKAFARQDGFFIGLLWIATFACLFGSMTHPDLQLGFVMGFVATPFIVFYRLKNFRNKVLSGYISYKRALCFTAMMLAYASLIIAAATLAYFYFFDNGSFLAALQRNLSLPEMRQAFTQAGLNPADLDEQISLVAKQRPIDFAFDMLCNGIVSSTFLAIIIAFFGKRTPVTVK